MKRHRFFLAAAFSLAALAACSSGGNDIPNVAGTYLCTSGCTGENCEFDAEISIVQDEGSIILEADSNNFVGTIDDNGEFDITQDDGSCQGQFVQGTGVFNCELAGEDCQQATYKRQ